MSSAESTESSLTPSDTSSTCATTRKAAAKLRAPPPSRKAPSSTRASDGTKDLQPPQPTSLKAPSTANSDNPSSVVQSTTSSSLVRTPTPTPEPEGDTSAGTTSPTSQTPLAESLLVTATSPNSVSDSFPLDVISLDNNPRALSTMGDSAHYWIDNNGNALVLKFPAILDLDSSYSRIAPYFNLPNETVDIAALKKVKIQIELRPLTNGNDAVEEYPEEAIKCSSLALHTLLYLVGQVEEKRNTSIDADKQPGVLPFWRTYESEDRFSFLINTQPIFVNLPDPKKIPVVQLSRKEISASSLLMSPSKLKEKHSPKKNSSGTDKTTPANIQEWKMWHMPDPQNRFSNLLADRDFTNIKISVPEVRDGDGILIHPGEYTQKLKTGMVVTVDVVLKLWNIPGKKREAAQSSAWASKDSVNGSRIYQLMLNRMQILPIKDVSKRLFINRAADSDPKGKRKASEPMSSSSSSTSPTKKTREVQGNENSDDPFAMEEDLT